MSRDVRRPGAEPPNRYLDNLYKTVPTELTAAYTAISSLFAAPGAVGGSDPDLWLLALAVVLMALIPFYMFYLQDVRHAAQIVCSTISFPIWAANISSAIMIERTGLPPAVLTSVLIVWTLIVPLLVRR